METRLNPPAGDYALPIMQYVEARGTESPGFIQLRFQAVDERPAHRGTLTVAVTISTLDAAAVLHALRFLEAKGLLPVVPAVPKAKQ